MDRNATGQAAHCIGAGRITVPRTWSAPRHSHDFVEVMAVAGGAITGHCEGREFEAAAGGILFYPAGAAHQERACGANRLELEFLGCRCGSFVAPLLCHDTSGRIRILFNWLLEEQASSFAGKAVVMDAILGMILAEIRKASVSRENSLVEKVRAYMRDHLGEDVSVDQLAKRAGLSRAHFIRMYKAASGHTPMNDLRRIRVETARDRLITTTLPLKAIAAETGFCDEFHLSRNFQKQFHVPPGYFRK